MTSKSFDSEPWSSALADIFAFKKDGNLERICSRARDVLDRLINEHQKPEQLLAMALEKVFSEGFLAAYTLERFDESLLFAAKAVEMAEQIPHYNHDLARTLNNLALAHMERAEIARADLLFEQALALIVDSSGSRGLYEVVLSNQFALRGLRGDEAARTFQPAISSGISGLQYSGSEPSIHNNQALEKMSRGEIEEAISDLRRLLRMPTVDLITRATVLSNLGSALRKAGDTAEAKRSWLTAIAACEQANYSGLVLAGILYELGETQSRTGEGDVSLVSLKRAWDVIRVIAPRSRLSLLILRSLGMARFIRGDYRRARACLERGLAIYDEMRDDVAISEREHEGLFTLYRAISELSIWLSIHEGGAQFETLRLMQQAKARYWKARLRQLDIRGETGGKLDLVLDEDDIAGIIGANGVLIGFFVGANATFVSLVYNRWTQAYRVDVTEREFELMVEQLRRRLEAGLRGVELTAHLSEILLKNVRLDWEDVRLLLIAPDGPLWRIPIEVLLIQVSPVERKALGALAPVALIPSVSTIRQMQRREESVTQRVFLGVLYDGSTPSLALAGAPVEIDMIRAHVGADTVHVIIGGNGGISGISANVAYYLPTATYVHIAAHAFADEHGGEAYILLSDYRGRQERLVSSQIESLELSAKLVVLATCHSSLGRSSAGEGMVSLARSFLLAGAQCVVASLWQLDDAKSVHFFSLLYEYVKEGGSLARAFKRAKDSYSDAFGYDATWAGLTILGNTESWEDRYSPLFVAEGR